MSKGRVLVVDDEAGVLESVGELLDGSFEVLTASSAEQGLALLGREKVHVVISDLKMPGMDGLSFLSEVNTRHPGVARVLMTAYADMDLVIRSMNEGGIHRFVAKPYKPFEFLRLVEECVRIGRAGSEEEKKGGKRVVVVAHDSQIFLTRLRIVLSGDFDVRTTSNGLEVISIVTECPVAAVVLGLCLQNIDGPTIAEYLARQKSFSGPVVLLSGDVACPAGYLESIGARHWIDCTDASADQKLRDFLRKNLGAEG